MYLPVIFDVHYYQTRYRFYNYKSHSNDEAICLLINGSLSVNFTNCRRDRDRMAVGLTTIYLSNQCRSPLICGFESRSGRGVQHYVIKFVRFQIFI
jgi:hypothetical protein